MDAQRTISRSSPPGPGLDPRELLAEGLEHLRRLAREVWTDHNVHDPGITTLEVLCYALTDLAYRAALPIEDLLAPDPDAPPPPSPPVPAFQAAHELLPNRALTVLDYRKLLIDLAGVKNAWVLPVEEPLWVDTMRRCLVREPHDEPGFRPVSVRGLYRVLLELMDDVPEARRQDVCAAAEARLHANRSLCEDFVEVKGIERQAFIACGELELSPRADPARVEAEVLFALQQHLAPPVANYSLEEMRARPRKDGSRRTLDEILDGPLLACGFIDDEELAAAELRTELRLSDAIRVVMGVEGVAAVRELIVNAADATAPLADRWVVPVESGKQPTLDPTGSRLVLYQRGMPATTARADVLGRFRELVDAARVKLETPRPAVVPIPPGRYRNPGRYRSVRDDFPAIYGLGPDGPPGGSDDARKAQALRLEGYLLFFDQLMADYCARLARVKELLSPDPTFDFTRLHQPVPPSPGREDLFARANPGEGPENGDETRALLEWRNRLLDHLVARLAERFHDHAEILRARFGTSPEELIRAKCAFLASYPEVGSARGLGYDRLRRDPAALWNSENVSGIERRVALLLGIGSAARRNLGTVAYDVYAEIDATPGDEPRFRVRHRVTGKILLSSSRHYATRADAEAELRLALLHGQAPERYERKVTTDGKHYFNVVDASGEVVARRIEYFATPEALEAAIAELIEYLRAHYGEEGMYLMENVLLRPRHALDPLLPIRGEPGGAEDPDDDPYSYRVHVILPAYAGRFNDLPFRRHVEEVIRSEMPAHVLPKICWVGAADMARVEGAYRAWLEGGGAPPEERAGRLRALSAALYAAKNVYPAERLTPCAGVGAKDFFILGRAALGSMPEPKG